MELTAAVKGTEIAAAIIDAYPEKMDKVTFWSDSQCIIDQIADTKKSPFVFVANRISKIQKVSQPNQWRFVKSKLNPADLCSRGIKANESAKWDIYHKGPLWFRLPEGKWPNMKEKEGNEEGTEGKTEETVNKNVASIWATKTQNEQDLPPPPLLDEYSTEWVYQTALRYSTWKRKCMFLAAVKKCAKIWLLKTQMRAGRKRTQEIKKIEETRMEFRKEAEKEIMKAVQTRYFTEERRELFKKNIVRPNQRKELKKKSSPLKALNPFIGEDGLIRVGSRLLHSNLEYDAKFPVILPKESRHTEDLIRDEHLSQHHAGPNHVINQIRQNIWILRGLEKTKSTIIRCVKCQKLNKNHYLREWGCYQKKGSRPQCLFRIQG